MLRNGFLASGSADNTIKIWNVTDGSEIRTLIGHSNFISALVDLENGYLASGGLDMTIKTWLVIKKTFESVCSEDDDCDSSKGLSCQITSESNVKQCL